MRPQLRFAPLREEDKHPHMLMVLGLMEKKLTEPRLEKHGFQSLKTPCHLSPPPTCYKLLTEHF